MEMTTEELKKKRRWAAERAALAPYRRGKKEAEKLYPTVDPKKADAAIIVTSCMVIAVLILGSAFLLAKIGKGMGLKPIDQVVQQ